MHPMVKDFLEFRKTQKRSPKKSSKKSFCGSPKNKGRKRMGSPHECLKRGYGASSSSLISDLDKFFRSRDRKKKSPKSR